jgi:nitrate/nitrite transporter NarK
MATPTVPGDAVQDRISLTSEERALFDTLLAAAKFAGSNTVLRAAGGWVRDKLLGKESKDIDIALDNMLGKDFADKVGVLLLLLHNTLNIMLYVACCVLSAFICTGSNRQHVCMHLQP